ncbi:hypothetical protein KKG83_05970 [Candidatus Micrarchaeota archaeon]|nr:hypothetical protein [Candidatus Micrarchaeota archaeon]
MQDTQLAESISKAIDFNLSQVFNEIDLKVKEITFTNVESINSIKPLKQETKICLFSEAGTENFKSIVLVSFNKSNALMMVDLIKGANFGSTKLFSASEINALKTVSSNLFKAWINSLNSVSVVKVVLSEPKIAFSFSEFENELVAGNLKGKGRFFELSLTVGGTEIKGAMKFFALAEMVK